MIKIIGTTNQTKEDIIFELMKIENEVYEAEYRGKYDAIRKRFCKYPNMFYLAYDEEQIVGYLCYIPISQALYDEMIVNGCFHDDDIEPDDIVAIEHTSHLYLLSVAIYKKYQDTGIADNMMDKFEKFIHRKREEGFQIDDVIASTVTEDGEKYVKKYGYKLYLDRENECGFKVYIKEFGNE